MCATPPLSKTLSWRSASERWSRRTSATSTSTARSRSSGIPATQLPSPRGAGPEGYAAVSSVLAIWALQSEEVALGAVLQVFLKQEDEVPSVKGLEPFLPRDGLETFAPVAREVERKHTNVVIVAAARDRCRRRL